MSHQPTTTVASSSNGPLSSEETADHISSPAEELAGQPATSTSQASARITNSELLNTQEQHDDQDNGLENTQINSASYDADDEHVSQSPNSQSPSFTTEEVDQDIQEPIDNGADIPPATEEALRSQAIAWMEATYQAVPNGGIVNPPAWYSYDRIHHPDRPRIWIKDYFTGRVRARRLVNDRLASMSRAERERWANQQRRMRGNPAE